MIWVGRRVVLQIGAYDKLNRFLAKGLEYESFPGLNFQGEIIL